MAIKELLLPVYRNTHRPYLLDKDMYDLYRREVKTEPLFGVGWSDLDEDDVRRITASMNGDRVKSLLVEYQDGMRRYWEVNTSGALSPPGGMVVLATPQTMEA